MTVYTRNPNHKAPPTPDAPGTIPDKLQPYDDGAERALIGSILIDDYRMGEIAPLQVTGSDFFKERYGWAFDAMLDLYQNGQAIGLVTLSDRLERDGRLEEFGGPAELTSLLNDTPTSTHAYYYAGIIKGYAKQRQAIELAGDIARLAFEKADDFEERLAALTEKLQVLTTEDDTRPIFQPLTFQELLSRPPKQWLIKDIIGPGDLGMIFGDSGSGKTFLVIDLIMSAITGLSWARKFEVAEPLTVAYCTNEGLDGLPQRFQAAQLWYQASNDALSYFTFYPMLPQLFNQKAAAYITRFVSDYRTTRGNQLDLLIIDTLDNAGLGSKENDNSDASVIADATRIARDSLGCATILVHHAGKSGEYRGASAYKGDCDIMIKTERKSEDSPYIEFSCYKSKDEAKFNPLVFSLYIPTGANSCCVSWQGLASDNLGKTNELLSVMEEMPGQRLTAKQWGEAIAAEQNHAIAILNALHKAGKVGRELQFADKKKSSRNPFVYFNNS